MRINNIFFKNITDDKQIAFLTESIKNFALNLPEQNGLNLTTESDVADLLRSIGVNPDKKNIEIFKQLIKYELSVTKEQFDVIAGLLHKFKSLTAEKAAFLLANQISVDPKSIRLFDSLSDKNSTIINDLINVYENLDDSLSDRDQAENIKNAVRELFIEIDKLKSSDIKTKLSIEKVMEDIAKIIKEIKDSAGNLPPAQNKKFMLKLNELEDKFNLMNQIRSNYIYMQLPVNMNQYYTTAELYIMKNKNKKKTIDSNNATVFLSLHTANLGQVDAFVKVYHRNIECDFTMENMESLDFIIRNISHLYELLEAQGFKLIRVNYDKKKDESGLLDIINTIELKNANYSFDVRV